MTAHGIKKRGLTYKQIEFCRQYIIDFNATRAAKDAKYSLKTAARTGSENLQKPLIQKEIARLQEILRERAKDDPNIMTLEEALEGFSRIARFDIRKLYNEDGSLKKVTDLDPDTAYAISAVDVQESFDAMDEHVWTSFVKKIKASDKLKALDAIVRRHGGYEADNLQKGVQVQTLSDNERVIAQQVIDAITQKEVKDN